MKFHLILSLDYEVFGDGSGCLDHCVVAPTTSCLDVVEGAGATMTFFVDALEFSSFRKHGANPNFSANCSGSYADVEAQLVMAVDKGHRIELHLHPQWLGARRNQNSWALDFKKWRIGDLEQNEIDDCLHEAREYFSELLGENYTNGMQVFRAGGWAIQPSRQTLTSLSAWGVSMDSTVAPGMYNPSSGDWYDFRTVPDKPYWRVSTDVCVEDRIGEIIEVPIATHNIGFLAHAKALKEIKSGPSLPEGCVGSYAGPNNRFQSIRCKLAKIRNMGQVMLDFSTMPAWVMIAITEAYMERFSGWEGPVPIVGIGHNKNFTDVSVRNLSQYLGWIAGNGKIVFSGYAQWSEKADLTYRNLIRSD